MINKKYNTKRCCCVSRDAFIFSVVDPQMFLEIPVQFCLSGNTDASHRPSTSHSRLFGLTMEEDEFISCNYSFLYLFVYLPQKAPRLQTKNEFFIFLYGDLPFSSKWKDWKRLLTESNDSTYPVKRLIAFKMNIVQGNEGLA